MRPLLASFAAVLLAGCSRDSGDDLVFSGTVETREIQAGSKVGGRVVEVPIEEGQRIGGGTVMVRFDARELEASEKQVAARLAQAEADLARLRGGYRKEEIEQADAAVRREKAGLDALREGPRRQELQHAEADHSAAAAEALNAGRQFERVERLFQTGDVAAQTRDDARTRRDAAAGRAEAARQRLELLRAGTRTEDVRAGEARVEQAAATARLLRSGFRSEEIAAAEARRREAAALLEEIRVRLSEAEVRAPATCGASNCLVEVVSVRPGDLVAPGRAAVTLLEQGQLWVRIYVPEPKLAGIAVGRRAEVAVDALPGRELTGTVDQISARSEFLPRNVQTREDRNHQVFGAKVRVRDPEGILKSGMAATVRIERAAN